MTRTQKQIDNVNKLIKGFKSLPKDYDHLNMGSYIKNISDNHLLTYTVGQEDDYFSECNSTACVIGHGPMFGIPLTEDHMTTFLSVEVIDWFNYSLKEFGFQADTETESGVKTYSDWDFCFNDIWPNDIQQAIERLQMANTGNIPAKWYYVDEYKNGALV